MKKTPPCCAAASGTPWLTLEGLEVGGRSHTNVALCYLEDKADPELLRQLREKLLHMQINSIAMSQGRASPRPSPRPSGGTPSPRPGIPSGPTWPRPR